jgi:hypothetical protein
VGLLGASSLNLGLIGWKSADRCAAPAVIENVTISRKGSIIHSRSVIVSWVGVVGGFVEVWGL